jgi:hypothetical protein
MSKLSKIADQPALTDSGIEIEPIPEEFQVATIRLTRRMHWNGSTLPGGTTIGGIPMTQAKQMVEDHGVRIIGVDRSPALQRLQRANGLEGIEHKLPAGLSSDFEAIHTVPGLRSSVFVNVAEWEALRNR